MYQVVGSQRIAYIYIPVRQVVIMEGRDFFILDFLSLIPLKNTTVRLNWLTTGNNRLSSTTQQVRIVRVFVPL